MIPSLMMSGFGRTRPFAIPTFATFDPAAKSAHIALSGGNLIATGDGNTAWKNVACTQYKSTGLLYCEVTFANTATGRIVGLSSAGDSIADGYLPGSGGAGTDVALFINGDGNPYFYRYGSAYVTGPGGSGLFVGFHAGDVISLLRDCAAQTVRAWVNGVDVVSGSSQFNSFFGGVTGARRVVVGGNGSGVANGMDCTINTGATPWAYAPPAGATGYVIY